VLSNNVADRALLRSPLNSHCQLSKIKINAQITILGVKVKFYTYVSTFKITQHIFECLGSLNFKVNMKTN